MQITERPSLKSMNTFGVEASAALRIDIESEEDVLQLPTFNPETDLILGGGSNILLIGDIPGNVLVNRIRGRHIVDESDGTVIIEIGAGENWHETVEWTLDQGFHGLENLALIPGSVGAAPMQNIGAYGVELASRVESVTAWDTRKQNWRVIPGNECEFSYRDSRFKSSEPHRFLITSLRMRLDREFQPELGYQALAEELGDAAAGSPSARRVFEAVMRIRKAKLPDPAKVGNAGSFFKNPVVGHETAESLTERYPGIPCWQAGENQRKLSAAWMIEHCGLKGFSIGPAGVSGQHALVLVNHGDARGEEIWEVARKVRSTVFDEFAIKLEPEPRIFNLQGI